MTKRASIEKKIGQVRGVAYTTDIPQRWVLKWSYPVPGKKYLKREQKVFFGLKVQAEREIDGILRKIDENPVAWQSKKDPMTMSEYLSFWLEHKSKGADGRVITDKTVAGYEYLIPKINHYMGSERLASLSPIEIRQFVLRLQETSLGPSTQQKVLRLLKQCLSDAVAMELISRNPAAALKIGQQKTTPRTSLSEDHVEQLMQVMRQEQYGDLFGFMLVTGTRIGEALGVSWDAVEWDTGTVLIKQKVAEIRNTVVLEKHLKTPQSRREIELPRPLLQRLRLRRKLALEERSRHDDTWNPENLIFVSQNGTMLRPNNMRKVFNRAFVSLGIDRKAFGYTPHSLWHTFASFVLANKPNMAFVSDVLGHANPAITARFYAHVLPGDKGKVGKITTKAFYRTRIASQNPRLLRKNLRLKKVEPTDQT